jgi:hypothetical protein
LLNPLVRRTWAVAGVTPVFYHRHRSYKHLSAIAALSISPRCRRLGFGSQLHRDSIKQRQALGWLRQLLLHLKEPIVLVWDRLPVIARRLFSALLPSTLVCGSNTFFPMLRS